jgi:hypothetical protein
MRTTAKEKIKKEGVQQTFPPNTAKEIKPDYPLSEKDEVKQAEEKLRKAVKKTK